jgi:tetraacyldisaccharide 4'-kinase
MAGERLAIDTQSFHALIRGEQQGCVPGLARGILGVASLAFGAGAGLRRFAYDVGALRAHRAGVPVVSVGNLTAGGTGKTPLVIHLARELLARGEAVAVLARGYGAERDGELNDELRQIQADVPDVKLFPGRDRVARAGEAVAAGATVLLLDDGFQHRRLARDVDIVVLDATEPWGAPPHRLLPRGLLREPARAVVRADLVVLSRAELASRARLEELEAELRAVGFDGPVLRMSVVPSQLEALAVAEGEEAPGSEPRALSGKGVIAACGIGNPKAFGATLAFQGARMSQLVALPDHYAYTEADVVHLEGLAAERAVGTVVVTAKDAVKLRPLLGGSRAVTWVSLGVEARLEPPSAIDELHTRVAALQAKQASP